MLPTNILYCFSPALKKSRTLRVCALVSSFALLLGLSMALSACAGAQTDDSAAGGGTETIEGSAEGGNVNGSTEKDSGAGGQTEGEGSGETSEDFAQYPRSLSAEELESFTSWVSDFNAGNWGYLLSEYDEAKDLDINEVFYSGGGIESRTLTDEEEAAYLKATGQPEIYTAYICISTNDINDMLEAKLGLGLDDMSTSLDTDSWTYLKDFDLWIAERGDTNFVNFTCDSARETAKDRFEVHFVPDEEVADVYHGATLTMEASGSDYRILSNRFDS